MDDNRRAMLEKQRYRIVGEHTGVKLCHWLGEKLLRGRACYKETFYGIKSHRCLQMSPSVDFCDQSCLFCWRDQGFTMPKIERPDDPEMIVEGMIEAQRNLITGYKGDPRCDPEMWKEANEPNMVAISLTGEPTIYPYLGDFIEVCKKRGMTTFLVTNGTYPKAIENMSTLPDQLYVTVAAPNEEIYKKLCVPRIADGWGRLMETLELMPSLDTRTVVRHTLVNGHNLGWEQQYAKLDSKADPDFVEPKGYVFVGYSRERMHMDNMPSQETVLQFSRSLADLMGKEVIAEKKDSRVALIGDEKAKNNMKIKE